MRRHHRSLRVPRSYFWRKRRHQPFAGIHTDKNTGLIKRHVNEDQPYRNSLLQYEQRAPPGLRERRTGRGFKRGAMRKKIMKRPFRRTLVGSLPTVNLHNAMGHCPTQGAAAGLFGPSKSKVKIRV